MLHVLVTGAGGMLGTDLVARLERDPGVAVEGRTRAQLDIDHDATVTGFDVVINAAAWTDVDGAEAAQAQATRINGHAVQRLAVACADAGAHLIQISTDYVFPGHARSPIAEGASTAPLNAYGRGKLVGELAALRHNHFVVRTAWLFGSHGRNFVTTILKLARERETLDVVDDQVGQPTWTVALADQLAQLGHAIAAGKAPSGVYHGTSTGQTTWFSLAQAAFAEAGLDPARVRPTSSDAFPRPARRPAYSVLGHDAWAGTGVPPQPPWREQLRDFIRALPPA